MDNKKYISVEDAIKTTWMILDGLGYAFDENPQLKKTVPTVFDTAPTADVRPVVRGHKVTHNRPIAGYWASGKLDGGWDGMEGRVWVKPIMDNPVDYCSECGKRLDDTFQNFCPNCGARMEES